MTCDNNHDEHTNNDSKNDIQDITYNDNCDTDQIDDNNNHDKNKNALYS